VLWCVLFLRVCPWECPEFCVEGHTVSLMAGGLYGGSEGIG
jgi:hypothetical protein